MSMPAGRVVAGRDASRRGKPRAVFPESLIRNMNCDELVRYAPMANPGNVWVERLIEEFGGTDSMAARLDELGEELERESNGRTEAEGDLDRLKDQARSLLDVLGEALPPEYDSTIDDAMAGVRGEL